MKYKNYVAIMRGPAECGKMVYVTGVDMAACLAWLEEGKPALAMGLHAAEDLAYGLRKKGFPAVVVKMPDFYEPVNPEGV